MARLRLRSVGAPVPARPACDVGPGGGCGHSCTLRLCSAARPRTWSASKMTGSVWLAGGQGDPWLPRGRAPRAGSWRRRHCRRQADCGRGRPAPWLPPQVRPARSPWPAPRGESYGLLGCRRPGSQLAEVRTGRAKSRKASGTTGEPLGGARQAGGRMSGTGCLAAGGAPPDTIGGSGMLLDRPHVRLAVRWPAP